MLSPSTTAYLHVIYIHTLTHVHQRKETMSPTPNIDHYLRLWLSVADTGTYGWVRKVSGGQATAVGLGAPEGR